MKQLSVNGFQAAGWCVECQWLVALLQKKRKKSTERDPQLPFLRNFNNPCWAAGSGFLTHGRFNFETEMDVVCAATRSLAHSINYFIHNLHIYLRVNICKTETGHFCEFSCSIASLHRNMGQARPRPPSLPLPVFLGALCSLLVSVRPHWKHRKASVCRPSSSL